MPRRRVSTPEQAGELALEMFWFSEGTAPEWYEALSAKEQAVATAEAEAECGPWRWTDDQIEARAAAIARQRGIA